MDFDSLYFRTLKYLNFRPRSEKEIRDYLALQRKKDPSIDLSLFDIIIHKLKQQKFLNDDEFVKMWIRSRTQFKPKGKFAISLELKQKGISSEEIEKAFEEYDKSQEENKEKGRDEVVLAVEILSRKRKKYESMESRERFAKAGSMLARRGFDLDTIKQAIDQVFGKMV